MRSIWKRGAYFTLLAAGLAVAAASCTDTATSPPSDGAAGGVTAEQKLNDLREEYGWAGDYHTRALEHSYRHLVKHDARSLSVAEKCKVAEAALRDFTKTYRRDGRPLGVTDVTLAGTACEKNVTKQIVHQAGPSAAPRTNELSVGATTLLAQVESMAESDASVEAIRAAINDLQRKAVESLSETEAGAVIAAGELAISSVEYWNVNLPAWDADIGGDAPVAYTRSTAGRRIAGAIHLTPGQLLRSGGDSRTRRVIKADVTTFVVSIAASWWAGPIAWEASAVRGAAASIIAGMFPY